VIPYPISVESSLAPLNADRDGNLLYVGSIQPRKGVDIWARSLNEVLQRRPEARAIMVGPDTPTAPDGSSMAVHVRNLIDARHAERLTWLGPRSHADVQNLIGAASLVVVPSVFESFSFVAAEALIRGTPVLVSDQVGIAEHVAGLPVCTAGDASAWSIAQLKLLADLPGAARQAIVLRDRLLDTCAPARHLEQRAAFVDSLQAARPDCVATCDESDGLDELANFIDEVEAAEHSMTLASSI
jgi:glycosyltransferase involved in cell wall biosynthesis